MDSALKYDRAWNLEKLPLSSRNGLLVDWVGRDKNVLEMGCATGFLSRYFVENGCRVTGFEYDRRAAAKAKLFCEQVTVGDLNSPNWAEAISGKFDVVVFGDVLEHLIEPVTVLRESRNLLIDDGRIIVSLPNIAFLSERFHHLIGRWKYTETGIMDRTHLRFFTLETAQQMFFEADCAVVRFKAISGLKGAGRSEAIQALTARLPGLFGYQFLFELRSIIR